MAYIKDTIEITAEQARESTQAQLEKIVDQKYPLWAYDVDNIKICSDGTKYWIEFIRLSSCE